MGKLTDMLTAIKDSYDDRYTDADMIIVDYSEPVHDTNQFTDDRGHADHINAYLKLGNLKPSNDSVTTGQTELSVGVTILLTKAQVDPASTNGAYFDIIDRVEDVFHWMKYNRMGLANISTSGVQGNAGALRTNPKTQKTTMSYEITCNVNILIDAVGEDRFRLPNPDRAFYRTISGEQVSPWNQFYPPQEEV